MSALVDQLGGLAASGSSAVAVTEVAAVVVGPVDLQRFDRFTVYIYNAGGGSADALSNVTLQSAPENVEALYADIDTAVLAAPLAAAGVAIKSFSTKSLKYVRLTAACAAADDSTARFWISAGADL